MERNYGTWLGVMAVFLGAFVVIRTIIGAAMLSSSGLNSMLASNLVSQFSSRL